MADTAQEALLLELGRRKQTNMISNESIRNKLLELVGDESSGRRRRTALRSQEEHTEEEAELKPIDEAE